MRKKKLEIGVGVDAKMSCQVKVEDHSIQFLLR